MSTGNEDAPVRLKVMMRCERSICVAIDRHWLTALSNDEWQVDGGIEIGKYTDHFPVVIFGGKGNARTKEDNRE
jgi:hypothetical protein